jgi:uncharacterized tellurite resistance protein B-like protein
MTQPQGQISPSGAETDMPERRKRKVLAALVRMAEVDGELSALEEYFLFDVSDSLGLEPTDLIAIMADPQAWPLDPPRSEQQRMALLYRLLFMMKVDGELKPRELRMCRVVAFRLGFREDMTDELIRVMRDHIRRELPPDTLLNEVRKYMN